MPTSFNYDRYSGPTRVAIYTRFSSDLQRPTSPEDQERECRDAAAQYGWTVLDQFIRSDRAVSGQSLLGRDGLDQLVKLAEQPDCPFDGILIDDTSRFGRNLSDTLPLSDRLKFANVFLYFVNRRLDSRDPNFRTLFIAYGQQDEQYSLGVGEKVHRGQKGRALDGCIGNGRVYGFTNVPIEDPILKGSWGRPVVKSVTLVKNPEEAAVILRIFDMYITGLGPLSIARKLNDEGVLSPLHGHGLLRRVWCAGTIKKILRNEKYRGVNVWNRTKIVHNPTTQRKKQKARPESEWVRVEVPDWRIVSVEQWNAAVRENQSRKESAWRKEGGLNRSEASRKYIFSGLLRCAECGGNFSVTCAEPSRVRYGCVGHRTRGSCKNKLTIFIQLLEDQLIQRLSSSLVDAAIRRKLCQEYTEHLMAEYKTKEYTVQQVASNLNDLQARKGELMSNVENLLDTIQDIGRNPALSKRLNSLDAEMRNIDVLLATQTEVRSAPLTEEDVTRLLDRKMDAIKLTLTGDAEVAKQQIRKHIATLTLTPVNTAEGPMYEVSGDVNVFALGDPDDVLLGTSLERSCKQYTSLSFPFKATLNPRVVPMKKVRGRRH